MLIRQIQAAGLLSFGSDGFNLPLNNLNVLIGANGSGKSNLIELLAVLQAAPTNIAQPMWENGGIDAWFWKDDAGNQVSEASISVVCGRGNQKIHHTIGFANNGGQLMIVNEKIEDLKSDLFRTPYHFHDGNAELVDRDAVGNRRTLPRENFSFTHSILKQIFDPDPNRYPALWLLQQWYAGFHFFRNWSFGPKAELRRHQSLQSSGDFLNDRGNNLVLVFSDILNSKFKDQFRERLKKSLEKLYEGIIDINFDRDKNSGSMQILLQEHNREIPASRLSDGTLRYLCLLAILLHPEPPPLIVIEEPELGLHPDVIPHVVELLQECSTRTQIVVTTHSHTLVDALTETPEAVIVCEKHNGQSSFQRLDKGALSDWLKKYSLGEYWSMGGIGGNRW